MDLKKKENFLELKFKIEIHLELNFKDSEILKSNLFFTNLKIRSKI